MPDLVIRETLEGSVFPDVPGSDSSAIVQKRINLPEGKKFRVKSIEVFDDDMYLGGPIGIDDTPFVVRQTYVTPYPIVLDEQSWGFTSGMRLATADGGGPAAGDNSVLLKMLDYAPVTTQDPPEMTKVIAGVRQVFPSLPTAFNTGFEWYTNHIYLSSIISWQTSGVSFKMNLSFHIHLEVVNTSSLENAIGSYKEMLEAQCRVRTNTINSISPNSSAAGRSFPSWKFGGARPEIMVTSANVLRYYNKLASAAYQEMDAVSAFRTRFKEATTMVDYDAAFGDTTTNILNWITIMNVAGVTSGPIRSYPPPVKFTGNGNTVMYDADGVPASIVT